MEKRLLITGFEPFGGERVNPSWQAVAALPEQVGGYALYKREIPVVFGAAAREVLALAEEIRPQVILCVGQAGGRSEVTPERFGVNLRDARIPDNAGNQPREEPVVKGAPAAYFATVPVRAMAEAIQRAGLPGAVSNTAGTYVCNDLLYTLLHRFHGTAVRAGFLHVPYLPQQGTPAMPLEDMIRALAAAIEACGAE